MQPFVVSIADIEHAHFERVLFSAKNFDLVFIFKEGAREKGEEQFVRISSIPMNQLDTIKTWLDEVADVVRISNTDGHRTVRSEGDRSISTHARARCYRLLQTFTESTTSYNWKSIIEDVVRSDTFYLDEDPETGASGPRDASAGIYAACVVAYHSPIRLLARPRLTLARHAGEKKPAGWSFLTDEGWKEADGVDGEDAEASSEESAFTVESEESDEDSDSSAEFDELEDEDDDDVSRGGAALRCAVVRRLRPHRQPSHSRRPSPPLTRSRRTTTAKHPTTTARTGTSSRSARRRRTRTMSLRRNARRRDAAAAAAGKSPPARNHGGSAAREEQGGGALLGGAAGVATRNCR